MIAASRAVGEVAGARSVGEIVEARSIGMAVAPSRPRGVDDREGASRVAATGEEVVVGIPESEQR